MRIFTVHRAPGDPLEEVVLVKEGFAWPALFFGPIWALWHGMWLWAVIWLAVAAFLGVFEVALPGMVDMLGVIELALMVLFAAEGNELRRRTLARQRLVEVGVVGGPDHEAAARRFIDLASIGAR